MTNDVLMRELKILTTQGGMSWDEAIEFLSKAAAAAGGKATNGPLPVMSPQQHRGVTAPVLLFKGERT